MKKSFLNHDRPLLTAMLFQYNDFDQTVRAIQNGNENGADAFCLQIESLKEEYKNLENYKKLFDKMQGKPCYVANYRSGSNEGKSDEVLADEMLEIAENGATLCDVMGDMFCKHPEELTDNPEAIEKQMKYIEALHEKGAEVIMSSHVLKFTPAERVLEIAFEQKRRGADIIKIVTGAETMEEQIENLRITALLKKELGAPFLFLSGGECSIHRRLGMKLGCCMCLCVCENQDPAIVQPLLKTAKAIRDDMGF